MVHSLLQIDTRQVRLEDTSAQLFITRTAGKLGAGVIVLLVQIAQTTREG
jgi:hypothetical protein